MARPIHYIWSWHLLIAVFVLLSPVRILAADSVDEALSGGSDNYLKPSLMSAASASAYAARIKAAILPRIIYVGANAESPVPAVEVKVQLHPDGAIKAADIVKASGVDAWDSAVMRALARVGKLPLSADGKVPAQMFINFLSR